MTEAFPRGLPATLLAVPNISEGRDSATIDAIRLALIGNVDVDVDVDVDGGGPGERADKERSGIRLLDVHSDPDHHRSVYTLAGPPGAVSDAVVRAAHEAVSRIDVMSGAGAWAMDGRDVDHGGTRRDAGDERSRRTGRVAERKEATARRGEHPHVGALDVAPVVYLDESTRGAAIAQALVLADRIGAEVGVPVFLYGDLGGGRTRAQLRAGGVSGLARRIALGEMRPDFGPSRLHPTAGATLVAAREPLVAFNLRLAAPATADDARRIAALIREGGAEGMPGVRAIGVRLVAGDDEVAQISANVEDPLEVPLANVIERVRRHAEILDAELVGLAPRAAFEGMPDDVELPGFDPARHVIENVLGIPARSGSRLCVDHDRPGEGGEEG